MRIYSIAKIAVLVAVCLLFAGVALGQPNGRKTVTVTADSHYDQMSDMGRLAYVVQRALQQLPAGGRGQSYRVLLANFGALIKRDCLGGDEDCGDGIGQDGPGSTQSEMSMAVDPTGLHIVVGFNDFRGFSVSPQSVSGYAYSDDGGLTFTDGQQLPNVSNGNISGTLLPQVDGDPDIKYVPGGAGCQFIYTSIMVIGYSGTPPNFTGTAQTMSVHRSTDCGHTWQGPYEVTAATNPTGVKSGNNARDAADKEFIDVDPETGRVLMSWSNFTATSVIPGGVEIRTTFSDNMFSATPPAWSAGVVVNPGDTTFDTGSQPRFAKGSNNVYVAFATQNRSTGGTNTRVATSTDNGVSFGAPVTLQASEGFFPDYILGDDRIHAFPFLGVDNSGGPNAGNVYVTYIRNDNHDGGDIVFQRSTDNGATWSAPELLNANPGFDRSQWFPAMAVDKDTGRINIMWDDQFAKGNGDDMQMRWSYSDDAGNTWSQPAALTRVFHGGYGDDTSQPNLGDYNYGVAQGGVFYAVFPMVPNVAGFNDGQPTSAIGYPTFLGNTTPGGTAPSPGFVKATGAAAALDYSHVTFTESGGNGNIDAGDQVRMTIPLRNYVSNGAIGSVTYSNVTATLSSTTPGITFQRATSTYPNIAPGATQNNSQTFVFTLSPGFVPGTNIDLTLAVSTGQGSVTLSPIGSQLGLTMPTGTPVVTTFFSENFDGVAPGALPAGWTTIHVGGTPTVPWTTNNTFCNTGSNALFHQNANDGTGGTGNPTRFERVASPNITIPANAQYVTIDFDVCYDTEEDPNYNVLGYDGADLRITDFTPGHFARANFATALSEYFYTGGSAYYPRHAPRSSNTSYFQDISMWSGLSNGFQHVSMKFDGMAGDTVQLRPDFTQDGSGTCTNIRPTDTSCGVMIDNIVMNAVTLKSDELSTITLRPVSGQAGVFTGVVTAQPIAGQGGILVNLSSSAPGQTTMPPSVTIPQGSQTSPPFTVTVSLHTTAVITATGPSNARSAQVVVQ
jgi:hypothetical protein